MPIATAKMWAYLDSAPRPGLAWDWELGSWWLREVERTREPNPATLTTIELQRGTAADHTSLYSLRRHQYQWNSSLTTYEEQPTLVVDLHLMDDDVPPLVSRILEEALPPATT
ncbi:hypothetical protein QEG98_42025 (plasmid) [Myxococcus sp. MxC21-1]|uniref:hypothetical protein n=1 Tax=Myxococcus sp. MxC21-1 TaxID=3041439 RepID=UPI0029317432|nr:hypothetical protein [Myxococcus sp. MxC21-1]WNZ66247.1 hypothetical protein QEG98_42025 [Myxococcus sp. MxC21-1]